MNDLINNIKKEIEKAAYDLFGGKLIKVILYGSYARGDFNNESDIDFAFLLKISEKEISLYHERIGEVTSRLSIHYGVLISVIIISADSFNNYKEILPFYMNLVKDGIIVYG